MLAAAGFGIVIGLALGLLGAGGSVLAVPALVYGVGQPVGLAIPASLMIVGLAGAAGLLPRLGQQVVRWSIAGIFGGAGIMAAFAGAAVGRLLAPRVLLLAFAMVMVVAAVRMLIEPAQPQPSTSADRQVHWRAWLPRALGVGAVVGFVTGLFGVGGGFLIVPALLLLLRLEMAVAVGTSLVIVVINSVAGLVAHLPEAAQLNYPVVAAFTGAALVTAGGSAWLAQRLEAPSQLHRRITASGQAGLMRRRPTRVSTPRSGFAGFRFPSEVITLAVRWYLRYGLSYRDVEELLAERDIAVDHVTIYRWVQRFTPLLIDAARLSRSRTSRRRLTCR
jgi:uncharacterized membrane protein YfcA